jgi:hypothetical protein
MKISQNNPTDKRGQRMKKTRFLKSVGCLYPLVKFKSHVKSKLLRWPLWGVFVLLLFCQVEAQIATANNPHGKIKIACNDCHTTKNWSPLRLDLKFKHEKTGFALEGQHAVVACKQCHASLKFTGASKDCKSCHQDVHNGTLGQNCERCHTFQSWQDVSKVTVVHQSTRFPLLGRHQHVGCDNCHASQGESRFINMPLPCGVCHRQEYEATTNPNHRLAGFSLRCEICHSSAITGWQVSGTGDLRGFDHNRTQFPLTGAHLAVACDQCHVNNRFTGTPKDCFSCHQSDFQSTTNPNHVAANFSQTCTSCHTTSAWKPATFDHNKTRFPLLGAHATTACAQCHVNNRFAGTPADCFSYHQADFQRPTNPNHVTLNFSHDCTSCHTMNAWTPATFDHDGQYFRIYSGKHRGKWQTCATCHVNATNYKVFECILCHAHNQTKMDDKHRNRQNYQYNSQACYNCHPRV